MDYTSYSLLDYASVFGLFLSSFVIWITSRRFLKQNAFIRKQEVAFYCLNSFHKKLEEIVSSDVKNRRLIFSHLATNEKPVLISALETLNNSTLKDLELDLLKLYWAIAHEENQPSSLYILEEVSKLRRNSFEFYLKCVN